MNCYIVFTIDYDFKINENKMAKIELKTISEDKTCILCGEKMTKLPEDLHIRCDYCGKIGTVNLQCENSHYICTVCNNIPALEFIKSECLAYKGIDPIELAVRIMNSPIIRMHGPEHHFIVPAVLLTCIHNLQKDENSLAERLEVAVLKTNIENPNVCSFAGGTCGAAIGAGIFLKIFTKIKPIDEDEWSLSNILVAECLKNVSELHLPRCCKRDTYISLQTTAAFLEERFALKLPVSEAKCTFSLRNQSCGHEQCHFYNLSNSLV
jgi:hypothetical protein